MSLRKRFICGLLLSALAASWAYYAEYLPFTGKWIASYRKENKRRCLQIQRQDILPLILYVAQHRYLEEIGQDMSSYRQKDALELFRTLADSTLAACNMSRLNEAYELDAVLCACYQAEEMFGYAELLELKLTK